METIRCEELSSQEKKIQLYFRQKALLDRFLENGAITQAQYHKSFTDLTEKMGMQRVVSSNNSH